MIFAPLAYVFGRPSIIFWSLLCVLACSIWSAFMTQQNDYIPFVMSRLLSGIFGSLPANVGASIILDVFFLHQRGRAFLAYSLSTAFGVIAAPTFGGFILGSQEWPVCFWWTVALLGIAALLVFFFLDETTFDRPDEFSRQGQRSLCSKHALPGLGSRLSDSLGSRLKMFFPGKQIKTSAHQESFVSQATM